MTPTGGPPHRNHRDQPTAMSPDRYIVSRGFDWLFIIGSPPLAIAVVLGGGLFVDPQRVSIAVAFIALGHHIPTFLRAYGDSRERRSDRLRSARLRSPGR